MSNFWDDAEVISVYTRKEAIEDGTLMDVTEQARNTGITVPVAVALGAWSTCVEWTEYDEEQYGPGIPKKARLKNLLHIFYMAIKMSNNSMTDRIMFEVPYRDRETGKHYNAELVSVIGPGDTMDPVITIMFPWEE